jgi:hypothetical protein
MEIQQLKLLAARIHELLQQTQSPVGYNQSLDLSSSLAGLRNWPEVLAFPARIAACRLDAAAISRLIFRMKHKLGVTFSHEELLAVLDPAANADALEIWPSGPQAGVYLTTSQTAINTLLERFAQESDGSLVYAERAGNHWDGSIDLGENGLYSTGLERVPSGTLIIVGPIDLEQSSWEDSTLRLQQACFLASLDHHRVAALVNTPTPERLCEDTHLMVRSHQNSHGAEDGFMGLVSETGELITRTPFAQPKPFKRRVRKYVPKADAIPARAQVLLKPILSKARAGLLILGSAEISEHSAAGLIEAGLALTEHAGPAARIMPRTRSTPAKYWHVPEPIKELPFLPSVQSAYDQGYRRMVVYGNYTEADLLLEYEDVLFLASGWGSEVAGVFMTAARTRTRDELQVLQHVLAILAVTLWQEPSLTTLDMYLRDPHLVIPPGGRCEEVMSLIESRRALRWEDEWSQLLGRVSPEQISEAIAGGRYPSRMLDQLLERVRRIYGDSYVEAGDVQDDAKTADSKMLELFHLVRGRPRNKGSVTA